MEFEQQKCLERIRSRNEYGILAIKNLILLNGAAAIAMLTLLGAMVEKFPQNKLQFDLCQLLPIIVFGFGSFLGAMSSGFANLSQQEYISGKSDKGKKFKWWAIRFVSIGYLAFLSGLVMAFFLYKN